MNSISQTPSIYQIRHVASGKVYVGSAINPRDRWKNHRTLLRKGTHHSSYLQHAWGKYGEDAFVFEIIEPVLFVEDLTTRETHWIRALRAAEPEYGYNVLPIAGSSLGMKLTEKQRTKRLDRFNDPGVRERHAAGQKARFADPEERARRSEQAKALWRDPEYRARMTAKLRESRADPEFRARAAEKTRQVLSDPDRLQRMAEAAQARWDNNPSHRATMSERIKAMWADPVKRKNLIEKQKAGRDTTEFRAKQRAAVSKEMKARWEDPAWRAQQSERSTRAERNANGTYKKKKGS